MTAGDATDGRYEAFLAGDRTDDILVYSRICNRLHRRSHAVV